MARYRNDMDDERDYYQREERFRREALGTYEEPYSRRPRFDSERRFDTERFDNERGSEFGRGRFGERANYEQDEPRYSNSRDRWSEGDRFRDEGRRSSLYDVRGDLGSSTRRWNREQYSSERSRLRCRDIMTKDLAVATRETSLTQVALLMKQEDTGVIPVVEYDVVGGNGRAADDRDRDDRKYDGRTYSRGKLIGLITDRDIAVRAVAEGKDCNNTRAEDIMSVDIHTVRPNDRVVDVIRMMGDKQVRRIPVVNENSYLVGMISMADVASETHEDRELAEALEDISKGTSFWNRVFG
ncbi:MAG TPA: CBS domain-containing protein [Pyrinomonadaceae bacterium]|nr:CBS domain-containing protein [Pyrinomonadaceae bacterium]